MNAERIDAVEVHVEAGIAQHAGLVLFFALAPDELFDIWVIDVEDDHFRGTTGLAAALDGACRRIGATHEAHGAAGRAAALQQFLARADLRQVDARTRAALEDGAFFAVPVEDAVHRVVDREDEAGAGLLRHTGDTDVEPHWAVERCSLGDEDELEFIAKCVGLGVVSEVAALDAPTRDGVDNAVDDLTQRTLALGSSGGATEVLLGHDVGGVQRPTLGELDAELLERDCAVFPVANARIATFPRHLIERMHTWRGEVTIESNGESFWR